MVVIVPSEQSADLRDYMSKRTKTDRLDAELLARLPVLHPEGLHPAEDLGPGDPLKRAVKIRAGLVHRRTAAMHRLDSLLEILGPGLTDTLGTRMTQTTFKFLTLYANPHQVKRLGAARLARWFQHHARKAWGPERAQQMIDAANETIALWGNDGLDYARSLPTLPPRRPLRSRCPNRSRLLDRGIRDLYAEADPTGIVLSAPGVGDILAGQIMGRLGDPLRFTSLAAARSFTGLIPDRTRRGSRTRPVAQPNAATPVYTRPCSKPPTEPASSTPRSQPATNDSCVRRAGTTTPPPAPSPLFSSPESCPAFATEPTTDSATSNGRPISDAEGRAIVADRYQIPPEVRAARRSISNVRSAKRRDERVTKGSPSAPRHRSPPHQHEPPRNA